MHLLRKPATDLSSAIKPRHQFIPIKIHQTFDSLWSSFCPLTLSLSLA